MELKEKELFEYLKCSLRYELIKKGIDIGSERSYKKLASKTINQWLASKCNGMKADSITLKKKWDKVAQENTDILNPKKILEGWGLLYRTYEYVTLNRLNFTEVNLAYSIEIPGTKIKLTGQLPPMIDRENYIELFIVSFDKAIPDRVTIDMMLKHTIDAYAIREMFNKDVVITYYVPAQGKTMQTLRSVKDFTRLKSILTNVGICLENNIIYPRETFLCTSCIVRDLCKSWTGNEDE